MESIENPWTWEEREQMVRTWLNSSHPDADVEIVAIPDIDDPPNWVEHASRYHGEAGEMFTSDGPTAELYRDAGWPVVETALVARDSFEGWRIRGTLRMLSTVSDRGPAIEVMSATIPNSVAELLYDEGLLYRLAYHSTGGEPVG
jgi:nicotinamide mononucleotide adenylyltransferase